VLALRADWEALCDATPAATPFQRPAWGISWMRWEGIEHPRVVAVFCGADLVGMLPAFLWGSPQEPVLSLLGAGVSDHLDALAAPGFEEATLHAARGWLEESRPSWTSCAFDEIGPRALLRRLPPPRGSRATMREQSVCPVLVVGEREPVVERVVPRAQGARLRKARRRAERLGLVETLRAGAEDFPEILRILFALHARRWASRGETGMSRPGVLQMHERIAGAFAARGMLRLYALRVGGRYGAVVYGLREGARLHLYMQGIEPELEHVSPGVVLLGAALEDALAEGVREIDFLRGTEPYKYEWGAADEPNVRLCLETPGHALTERPLRR